MPDLVKALLAPALLLAGLIGSLFLLPGMAADGNVKRASRYGSIAGLALLAIYVVGLPGHLSSLSLEPPQFSFRLFPLLFGVAIGLAFMLLVDWLKNGGGLAILTFLSTASTSIALYDYMVGGPFKGVVAYLALGAFFGAAAKEMITQSGSGNPAPPLNPSKRAKTLLLLVIPILSLIIVLFLGRVTQGGWVGSGRSPAKDLLTKAEHIQGLRHFTAPENPSLKLSDAAREGVAVAVDDDFRLIQDGQRISPGLLYADQHRPQTAASISISSTGRFSFVVLCDNYGCDDWRLVDLKRREAQHIFAGKYAKPNWVAWSPGDKYAVIASEHAAELVLIVINLATRESLVADYPDALSELGSGKAELSTVAWAADERGFHFDFLFEGHQDGTSVYEAFVDLASRALRCQKRIPPNTAQADT